MKRNILLVLSTSLFCGSLALAAHTDTAKTATNPISPQDSQTIAWIMVVDKNEMAAGKAAMQKSKNDAVKKYARELINDHTKNLSQTKAVSNNIHEKPIESDDSKNLQQKGKDLMTKLKGLKDKEFDKEYIDAMVNGHTEALEIIQGKMGQVTNPKLQSHVKATQDMIQKHLTDGKTVQDSLK